MPRQGLKVLDGLARFNYWHYTLSFSGKKACATTFRHLLVGTPLQEIADAYQGFDLEHPAVQQQIRQHEAAVLRDVARRRDTLRPYLGEWAEDDRCVALGSYLMTDKLWRQDREAWEVFKSLPEEARRTLKQLAKDAWPPSQWRWEDLLQTIARDQIVFEEILEDGPTKSEVVCSQSEVKPAHKERWSAGVTSVACAERCTSTTDLSALACSEVGSMRRRPCGQTFARWAC